MPWSGFKKARRSACLEHFSGATYRTNHERFLDVRTGNRRPPPISFDPKFKESSLSGAPPHYSKARRMSQATFDGVILLQSTASRKYPIKRACVDELLKLLPILPEFEVDLYLLCASRRYRQGACKDRTTEIQGIWGAQSLLYYMPFNSILVDRCRIGMQFSPL